MMLPVIVITIVGVGVAVLLSARESFSGRSVALALSIPGALLATSSVFLLPWVAFGPVDSFARNSQWLIAQAQWIEPLKQEEPFAVFLRETNIPSADEMAAMFEEDSEREILSLYQNGHWINGWDFFRITWQYNSPIAAGMYSAFVCGVLLLLINLGFLLNARFEARKILMVAYAALLGGLLLVFTQIPEITSFGADNQFRLRILMAMVESRQAAGPWLASLGWFAVLLSALHLIFPHPVGANEAQFDEEEDV